MLITLLKHIWFFTMASNARFYTRWNHRTQNMCAIWIYWGDDHTTRNVWISISSIASLHGISFRFFESFSLVQDACSPIPFCFALCSVRDRELQILYLCICAAYKNFNTKDKLVENQQMAVNEDAESVIRWFGKILCSLFSIFLLYEHFECCIRFLTKSFFSLAVARTEPNYVYRLPISEQSVLPCIILALKSVM